MKHWLSIGTLCLIYLACLAGEALARPPLFDIDPISDQTAEVGVLFQYQATYTVEDPVCWGGGVSFDLTAQPSGMTITTGGRIQWTPSSSQSGESYLVTVHATASMLSGDPCWGGTGQAWESFTITVPEPSPPTAAINVELTESAMNNALASLTEVHGINFGEYLAGFVDAWWVNVDIASIDVLAPSGATNRVRITATATANTVIDLVIFDVPVSGGASGWIEGDVYLWGSPAAGYKIMVHPTNINLDVWINGVLGWIADIFIDIDAALAAQLDPLPDLELNLGTEVAPLLTCMTPHLVTNADQTALVLEWHLAELACLPKNGAPSSQCVGVNYLWNDLGLSEATCQAYCSSIGKSCSNSCTTNRGYPNWGVEAWSNSTECEAYSTSGGQVQCTTNLANYGGWSERKYRCCCQ